jgi:hypothetical protein
MLRIGENDFFVPCCFEGNGERTVLDLQEPREASLPLSRLKETRFPIFVLCTLPAIRSEFTMLVLIGCLVKSEDSPFVQLHRHLALFASAGHIAQVTNDLDETGRHGVMKLRFFLRPARQRWSS